MSKKLDKSLMDAYLSVYEDKRGHAAGSSDAEKQASQLASDVRYKAKGKVPEGASKEEKRKIFLQILNASPAPAVVKQMAKEKLLGEQYLPEEEYDRYRDEKLMRGGDHRSKETKERSYSRSEDDDKKKGDTPMQKEFKKKYGKKATALDAVKADITAKYGKGAIMNVGKKNKKKANVQDEFDLTKIAEAFGGYLIEISDKKLKEVQDKALEKGKKDQAQRIQRSREARFDKELRGVGKVPTRSAFADQPKSKALARICGHSFG